MMGLAGALFKGVKFIGEEIKEALDDKESSSVVAGILGNLIDSEQPTEEFLKKLNPEQLENLGKAYVKVVTKKISDGGKKK